MINIHSVVTEQEALPGDIAILFNKEHPFHAVMLSQKSGNGQWLVNYSNGSNKYKKNRPITVFKDQYNNGGTKNNHTGTKYYRYNGYVAYPIGQRLNYYWERFKNLF